MNLNYVNFQKTFEPYLIFSIKDIEKIYPNFRSRRLVEWQNKNYITKIRNKYYMFTDKIRNETFLYLAANQIYTPSYISLETALSYYNVIPEGVFTITSVSTVKTSHFSTPIGRFSYRHLKPSLFFGYRLLIYQNWAILLAELEKTILDYLYLNKQIQNKEDINGLRWNRWILKERINVNKLKTYESLFFSKTFSKRVKVFILWLQNE